MACLRITNDDCNMLILPITAKALQNLYRKGENIISFLSNKLPNETNAPEIIEIAYDMQSGVYIKAMTDNKKYILYKEKYCKALYDVIIELGDFDTLLDAGIGEATTLVPLLEYFNIPPMSYGVEISWSRASYAKQWLNKKGFSNSIVCTGNLMELPFADNSIDIVFTSHAVEPNRGNEERILKELYRVARKYVVLLEPNYEVSNDEARARMDKLNYCQNLLGICSKLKFSIKEHRLFDHSSNSLNQTYLTVIEKQTQIAQPSYILACPEHKTHLINGLGALYSEEGLRAYPIIGDIPCLRVESSIFASHFEKFK